MTDDLRDQIASAIEARVKASVLPEEPPYSGAIGLASFVGASFHDLADAVLAVRDEELERLREGLAEANATAANACEDCRQRREEAEAGRDALRAAVERVRGLHVRNTSTGTCEHCSDRDYPDYAVPYPCPTIAALDTPGD